MQGSSGYVFYLCMGLGSSEQHEILRRCAFSFHSRVSKCHFTDAHCCFIFSAIALYVSAGSIGPV